MGLKIQYAKGATPLDPDDADGLIPSHMTTQGQLNEWEYANVARGEEWAFSTRHRNLLTVEFLQTLHRRMFGDTWSWAGTIRKKETSPVGVAPENIRPEVMTLLEDVDAQIKDGTWSIEEIAARFHHRIVYIHPFPNGNGRFSRTITDLLLSQAGKDGFTWGDDLEQDGAARELYIAALQTADKNDYGPLYALLKVNTTASNRD